MSTFPTSILSRLPTHTPIPYHTHPPPRPPQLALVLRKRSEARTAHLTRHSGVNAMRDNRVAPPLPPGAYSLETLAFHYGTDKSHDDHKYTDLYAALLGKPKYPHCPSSASRRGEGLAHALSLPVSLFARCQYLHLGSPALPSPPLPAFVQLPSTPLLCPPIPAPLSSLPPLRFLLIPSSPLPDPLLSLPARTVPSSPQVSG